MRSWLFGAAVLAMAGAAQGQTVTSSKTGLSVYELLDYTRDGRSRGCGMKFTFINMSIAVGGSLNIDRISGRIAVTAKVTVAEVRPHMKPPLKHLDLSYAWLRPFGLRDLQFDLVRKPPPEPAALGILGWLDNEEMIRMWTRFIAQMPTVGFRVGYRTPAAEYDDQIIFEESQDFRQYEESFAQCVQAAMLR